MTVFDLMCILSGLPESAELYIGTLPNDEQGLKMWDENIYPDGKVICELPTGS